MSFHVSCLPSLDNCSPETLHIDDDVTTMDDDDNDSNKKTYLFVIQGIITKQKLEYNVIETGKGNTFSDAVDNMYKRIIMKFNKKYGISLTKRDEFQIEKFYEIGQKDTYSSAVLVSPLRFEKYCLGTFTKQNSP